MTVRQVYELALAVMDEKGDENYARRAPAILNTLIGRCYTASEDYQTGPHSLWEPVEGPEDELQGLDRTLCMSALPYGLAAMLYLEEDPTRSAGWWSVFCEQVELCRRSPAYFEPIEDVYGGVEKGRWGRW